MQSDTNKTRLKLESEQKYITFSLGDEEYGVPVIQVVEIVKMDDLIMIPHSLNYFKGLLDIRKQVVPVIDLKKKLEILLDGDTVTNYDRAIIIKAYGKRIGLAVDHVSHVVRFLPENIDAGPPAVKSSANRYIAGVGKHKDHFIVLINLENLFSPDEIEMIFTH